MLSALIIAISPVSVSHSTGKESFVFSFMSLNEPPLQLKAAAAAAAACLSAVVVNPFDVVKARAAPPRVALRLPPHTPVPQTQAAAAGRRRALPSRRGAEEGRIIFLIGQNALGDELRCATMELRRTRWRGCAGRSEG